MSYETESNYSSWAVGWADFGASRQWTDPRNTATTTLYLHPTVAGRALRQT